MSYIGRALLVIIWGTFSLNVYGDSRENLVKFYDKLWPDFIWLRSFIGYVEPSLRDVFEELYRYEGEDKLKVANDVMVYVLGRRWDVRSVKELFLVRAGEEYLNRHHIAYVEEKCVRVLDKKVDFYVTHWMRCDSDLARDCEEALISTRELMCKRKAGYTCRGQARELNYLLDPFIQKMIVLVLELNVESLEDIVFLLTANVGLDSYQMQLGDARNYVKEKLYELYYNKLGSVYSSEGVMSLIGLGLNNDHCGEATGVVDYIGGIEFEEGLLDEYSLLGYIRLVEHLGFYGRGRALALAVSYLEEEMFDVKMGTLLALEETWVWSYYRIKELIKGRRKKILERAEMSVIRGAR